MMKKMRVIVQGREVKVKVKAWMTIGAITTKARWVAGCGFEPFDRWEVRDESGVLLNPAAGPGALAVLFVDLPPGIGG